MISVPYLNVSDDENERICQSFGKTLQSFDEDVATIREWIGGQAHLPETPCDRKIASFLLVNKCSIEKTKKKIDMYYTLRGLVPEVFAIMNPKTPEMQQSFRVNYFVPLPRLTPDLHRAMIFKINDSDVEKFNIVSFFAQTLCVCELRFMEDGAIGHIIIIDLANAKFGHLRHVSPFLLRKAQVILEKAYTMTSKAIHYINCPPFIDKFLIIIKSTLKEKIANRMHVHKDLESLYETFPKELLPEDYGGNEKSLAELNEQMKVTLHHYQSHFDHLDTLKVDESLRQKNEKFDSHELFGVTGTFKQLDVD